MKTFFFVAALLCAILIVTGCPGPSSSVSGVRTPNAIMDKSENTFVVYQLNEGDSRVTYVQRLGYYGNDVWEEKGIELYSEPGPSEGGGVTALLVGSNYGQTIVIWEDSQGIRVRKIDSSGRFLWDSGITVPAHSAYGLETSGDGEGGVILAWSDANGNLYVQRIGFDGNTLWKTESPLCTAWYFNLATDDAGNIFIAWEDKDFSILVQKLDPMGSPCWMTGGILLSDLHGTGDRMSSIISDGLGGAVIAWIYAIRSEDNSSVTGNELYAQRISAEGETLWETEGVCICGMSLEPPMSVPVLPQLVSDDLGGAFVVWRSIMSVYAQRISATGEPLWAQGGITIWDGGNAPQSPYFAAVPDDSGGFIVVWNYIEEGKTLGDPPILIAQRFDVSGNKLWGENGTRVTADSVGYISPMLVSPDGKGGVIVSWAAGPNIHNAGASVIQRVSSNGSLLWSENGIIFQEMK